MNIINEDSQTELWRIKSILRKNRGKRTQSQAFHPWWSDCVSQSAHVFSNQ